MKALVPLDGSDYANRILSTVRRLVELQPGVELHLVTVLDPKHVHGRTDHALVEPPTTGFDRVVVRSPLPRLVESHGQAAERSVEESRRWLGAFAERELPGEHVEVHVAWNEHPAEGIIALAAEVEADLIVMAAHGRSGLSHLVAGSVTEAVIRTAKWPVLVQGPAVP